jgi:hypothetical protein
MFGNVMVLAKVNPLIMAMSKDRSIENLNLQTIGLMIIRELAEENSRK